MATVELTQAADDVAVITLNRPEALNTLCAELVRDLHTAVDRVSADATARVVVLTGAGRAFCAGFDLHGYGDDERLARLGDVRGLLERQAEISSVILRLNTLPLPVIAAINGPCAGAGLSLATACDLRICAEGTVFSTAFLRAGVSACDLGLSWLLPRLVGLGRAQELMYTGRRFTAAEALTLGLVTDVVPPEQLPERTSAMAHQIRQNPPLQTRLTKRGLAAALQTSSLADVMEFENRQQVLTVLTDDYREAIDSYLEKRPPVYADR